MAKTFTKVQKAKAFKDEKVEIVRRLNVMITAVQSGYPLWVVETALQSIKTSHGYLRDFAPDELHDYLLNNPCGICGDSFDLFDFLGGGPGLRLRRTQYGDDTLTHCVSARCTDPDAHKEWLELRPPENEDDSPGYEETNDLLEAATETMNPVGGDK